MRFTRQLALSLETLLAVQTICKCWMQVLNALRSLTSLSLTMGK